MNHSTISLAKILAAVGVSMALAATARGGFTTVLENSFEKNHQQIFQHVYGGSWSANGLDYSNGVITATRIDDSLDSGDSALGVVDGAAGSATDKVWANGRINAVAKARYAHYQQSFGYYAGEESTFNKLFDVSGGQFNVSGQAQVDLAGQTWRWGRDLENGEHSSRDGDNIDLADHLVSYKIDGLTDGGATTWMLFWEDLNDLPNVQGIGIASAVDRDYNDLVVEVKATPIPLPPAVWSGLGLLLSGGLTSAWRRARN